MSFTSIPDNYQCIRLILCSPEGICGPKADLERFSKLGMGTFSTSEMECWSARCAFFAATRLEAVDALIELREVCLSVFSEAKRFWHKVLPPPIKVTWPIIRFVTASPDGVSHGVRALAVRDWETLAEGATQCPIVAQLNNDFKQWCAKYHFTERWLADSALTNLAMWSQSEVQREELCWPYPGSFVHSQGTVEVAGRPRTVFSLSATGMGLKRLGHRLVSPRDPPHYDPFMETGAEYERRVQEYRRNLEAAIDRLEIPRRRIKRARAASSSTHFVWLVQYQLLGWTFEQIAAQHDETRELEPASVGQAVTGIAKTMDMTLRPAQGRRKPRDSTA